MAFSSEPDDPTNPLHNVPTLIDQWDRSRQAEGDHVERAATFLELLGRTSLSNTQTAREERAVGSRAIRARRDAKRPAITDEDNFDELVGTVLEERGLTFEAELRYRSITPESTTATARLAQLLESKGCVAEATLLYAHAAAASDVNATWRLAVLSHQVGRRDWANDLADLAFRCMSTDSIKDMEESVRELSRSRHTHDLSGKLERIVIANCGASYALGSSLLIASGRPDLARLAYSSSTLMGDPLAANTLLSLPGRAIPESAIGTITDIIARSDVNHRARSYPVKVSRSIGRYNEALRSAAGTQSLPVLLTNIESRGKKNLSTQSILTLARTVTTLSGLAVVGCGPAAQQAVNAAGDKVCAEVMSSMIGGSINSEVDFINDLWTLGNQRLGETRRRRDDLSPELAEPSTERSQSAPRLDQTIGSVRRMRNVLQSLAADHRKIWTLSAASSPDRENSFSITGRSPMAERQICDEVNDRLRRNQRGEEVDQELWAAVDGCFENISDAAREELCTAVAESPHVQLEPG